MSRHLRRCSISIILAFATLSGCLCSAQQTASTTSVPNLIRYSGTLRDAQDAAASPNTSVGITFAIYQSQDGGVSVWQEIQNVTPDVNGQYSVILGSTTATGLPDDLFSQQEQRWLGVQVQGQTEQPRVLLVSVPYAFKAHDADTLGGLPASAFVKAPENEAAADGSNGTALNALTAAGNAVGIAQRTDRAPFKQALVCNPVTSSTGAPPNTVPMWDQMMCNLMNSIIVQNPNIKPNANMGIGIGQKVGAPLKARLDVDDDINAATTYKIGGKTVVKVSVVDNLFLGAGEVTKNAGNNNTFAGAVAGSSNVSGTSNTFVGAHVGFHNESGNGNTFLGEDAGFNNVSGSSNIFIGRGAGRNKTNTNSNIYIGHEGVLAEENTIRIGTEGTGTGQQTYAYIAGIWLTNVGLGSIPVFVNANGQLGTVPSSRRFKEQINDMGDSTDALMKLRPVTFLYKPEYAHGDRTPQYGLVAEEVAQVYPELVAYDTDGQPYTVRYQYLASMLLNEVQKQYHRAERQSEVIAAQQREIDSLRQQLQVQNATLQQRLSRLERMIDSQVSTVAQAQQ